jgi:hypothetical protein
MGLLRRKGIVGVGEDIVCERAVARSSGRHVVTLYSATALALCVYSLWESSLRLADVHLYVPPVQYVAP